MNISLFEKVLIVFITLLFLGFLFQYKKNDFQFLRPVEDIKKRKDSLEKHNIIIDQKIEIEEGVKDSLRLLLVKEQNKLVKLKEKKDEKERYINTTTDEYLLDFFSNFKTESSTN